MNFLEYEKNLALITQHNPAEPLLPTLKRGYSAVNALFMAVAMKRMPTVIDEPKNQDIRPQASKEKMETYSAAPDKALKALWAERTRLFGLMNKQSNEFHRCKTDEQRADNSKKVLAFWDDILAIKAKIQHFEKHGELPAEISVEPSDMLDDNPVKLSKQLNSLRARISQIQAQLKEIAGLDPNTPGKSAQIDRLEKKRQDLIYLRGLAEQKLDNYAQME